MISIKTIKHSIIVLSAMAICACGGGNNKQAKHAMNPDCVYVCSGTNAKRYHSVENCRGLSKCGGEILEMSVDEAEYDGKTPCKMCVCVK